MVTVQKDLTGLSMINPRMGNSQLAGPSPSAPRVDKDLSIISLGMKLQTSPMQLN